MAYTTRSPGRDSGAAEDANPAIQSPTLAARRIPGLQMASVQKPQNGFGALPASHRTTYVKREGFKPPPSPHPIAFAITSSVLRRPVAATVFGSSFQ